jgi:hypothetical protein
MLNLVSLGIGGITLLLALVAFLPLLGWANWFIAPVAAVGVVIGILSRSTSGRNLCLFVLLLSIVRLSLGGGIL